MEPHKHQNYIKLVDPWHVSTKLLLLVLFFAALLIEPIVMLRWLRCFFNLQYPVRIPKSTVHFFLAKSR